VAFISERNPSLLNDQQIGHRHSFALVSPAVITDSIPDMPSPLRLRERLRKFLKFGHGRLRKEPTVPTYTPNAKQPFLLRDLENILMKVSHEHWVRTVSDGRYTPLFSKSVEASLADVRLNKRLRPEHCRDRRFLGVCIALFITAEDAEYEVAVTTIRGLLTRQVEQEMAGDASCVGWLETLTYIKRLEEGGIDWTLLDVPFEEEEEEAENEPIDWTKA
ncbi:hypothetical protein FN846DRAFT_998029, partial [Sphaerosporella brunnea]